MPLNRNKFIEKATEIHNKKYNYSEVVFINGKTKVIIICPIHKGFEQRPYDHLKGHGCRKCGNEKNANKNRSNTDEFKLEATEIHEDKYDYSKVVYIDSTTKVIIICKIHGEFEQAPAEHKSGKGCRNCAYINNGINKRSNTDEFIKKAKEKHGDDKYDYSEVKYIDSETKVIIICKIHGEFEQRPETHLQGCGCRKCGIVNRANKNRSNTDEFKLEATEIHEDKYDYSKVEYIDSTTKVIIICKIHGEFEQAPSGHLQGAGCNQCAIETNTNNLKSNTDEFIKKAIKKYGDKYDYSKVEYIASREKVIIICKTHGEFEQRPTDHLSGYGCYRCSYSKQFSNTQIKWLQFLSVYYNIQIQHAENDTEYKIQNTRYKADGYCKETNTIYEFHGDFWHGNPNLFKENEYNKKTKCTFGELYQKTLEKEQTIKNLGYNLVTIWESDWKQINKIISVIQKKIKNYKSIRLL
jgi:hypothetical protein